MYESKNTLQGCVKTWKQKKHSKKVYNFIKAFIFFAHLLKKAPWILLCFKSHFSISKSTIYNKPSPPPQKRKWNCTTNVGCTTEFCGMHTLRAYCTTRTHSIPVLPCHLSPSLIYVWLSQFSIFENSNAWQLGGQPMHRDCRFWNVEPTMKKSWWER